MTKIDQMSSALRSTGKHRTWLYCRVDSLDATVMELQQNALRDYAKQQGWDIVGLTAEQRSGLSLTRPGITEISHAVEQGLVDVLLIMNISRLGRGVLEAMNYIRWLKDHDVRLICMNRLDANSFTEHTVPVL